MDVKSSGRIWFHCYVLLLAVDFCRIDIGGWERLHDYGAANDM